MVSRLILKSLIIFCKRGHPLTIDNLVPFEMKRGVRSCIKCRNDRAKGYNKKESHKESIIKWNEKNPNYFVEYHINNKEKRNLTSKIWDESHPNAKKRKTG